jgi:hypothetical protein
MSGLPKNLSGTRRSNCLNRQATNVENAVARNHVFVGKQTGKRMPDRPKGFHRVTHLRARLTRYQAQGEINGSHSAARQCLYRTTTPRSKTGGARTLRTAAPGLLQLPPGASNAARHARDAGRNLRSRMGRSAIWYHKSGRKLHEIILRDFLSTFVTCCVLYSTVKWNLHAHRREIHLCSNRSDPSTCQ